jgi:hypothetical protein
VQREERSRDVNPDVRTARLEWRFRVNFLERSFTITILKGEFDSLCNLQEEFKTQSLGVGLLEVFDNEPKVSSSVSGKHDHGFISMWWLHPSMTCVQTTWCLGNALHQSETDLAKADKLPTKDRGALPLNLSVLVSFIVCDGKGRDQQKLRAKVLRDRCRSSIV